MCVVAVASLFAFRSDAAGVDQMTDEEIAQAEAEENARSLESPSPDQVPEPEPAAEPTPEPDPMPVTPSEPAADTVDPAPADGEVADSPASEPETSLASDDVSAESMLQEIAEFIDPSPVAAVEPGLSEVERSAEERLKNGAAPSGNVGQVRTEWGTIDLNQVSLEQLYDSLDTQTATEEMRITLENVVFLALDQNQDIQIAEYGPLKVDGDILAAKGEFDPKLVIGSNYSEVESAASSQTQNFLGGSLGGGAGGLGSLLGGLGNITSALGLDSVLGLGGGGALVIENHTLNMEAKLQGKIPTGTQYELKLTMTRDESTFNNFEPEFNGGGTITITQPLLKGAGFNNNLFRVRSAKNNRVSSEYRLRQQVEATVSDVMRAYWDLVSAQEQYNVRKQSLDNAKRLRESNERRLELGQSAALEVIQAKASEATRLSDVIAARNQVMSAEDRLKVLLDMREEERFSSARLVPVDRPSPDELNLDVPVIEQKALASRVEILSGELDIETAELDVLRTRNELLPQLDFQVSYYRGAREPRWQDVYDGLTERKDTTWTVGIQGTIPIPNRTARGTYYKSQVSKREYEQRLEKTRLDIVNSVRNAVRSAATARVQLESNRQARALQETNVEAEEKKQKLGISDSFQVLRIQEDLANAQVSEVLSMIDLEKALIDIALAEGTLLENYGITLEAPEKEVPISFVRSITPLVKK
ncbi:MAG: hypothetical protein AMXMBFR84_41100 [Candidatus Hydrogenedentota bacterium]